MNNETGKAKTKSETVHGIFQNIAPEYDKANDRISLGMQKSWKKMLTDRLENLPENAAFLDVCCGTGDIAISVSTARRDIRTTGLDFSDEMLAAAAVKAKGLDNLVLIEGDAMNLPFEDDSFDAASISFGLRNTSDYEQVLREMTRVVKKDGQIYCLDSFVPTSPIVLPFYRIYFNKIMPLIGGGQKYREDYRWLSKSTEAFLKPIELMNLFRTAGCTDVQKTGRMFGACVLVRGKVL